jgi:hypothetical protein
MQAGNHGIGPQGKKVARICKTIAPPDADDNRGRYEGQKNRGEEPESSVADFSCHHAAIAWSEVQNS